MNESDKSFQETGGFVSFHGPLSSTLFHVDIDSSARDFPGTLEGNTLGLSYSSDAKSLRFISM